MTLLRLIGVCGFSAIAFCFIYIQPTRPLSLGGSVYYLLRSSACSDRNAATPFGDASIPALPSSHCAGHTSPCFWWKFSASTMRSISSMLRPSGRSLTTWWRTRPSSSIRKEPRKATPASGCSTSYALQISCLTSATRGYLTWPIPPSSIAVLRHALWENWESIETPITSTPLAWKSARRLSNAISSDGQTKVKSNG